MSTSFTLETLAAIIAERMAADPAASYTAKLAAAGMPRASKKLGEEAVEAVIAAVTGDRSELVKESADVLYHLLVVLRMAELARRTSQSGIAEKASRRTGEG
jgi:phosphoribosyl-ATP pyrophosphohydrolase